jgi:hypothetical protein
MTASPQQESLGSGLAASFKANPQFRGASLPARTITATKTGRLFITSIALNRRVLPSGELSKASESMA